MKLWGNDLAGSGGGLGRLMLCHPEWTVIDLVHCSLKSSDIDAMAQALDGHTTKVSDMKLWGNDLTGSGGGLGRLMLCHPEWTVIDLSYCNLKSSDIDAMAQALEGHTTKVTKLNIRWNNDLFGGEKALLRLLERMPQCAECIISNTRLNMDTLRKHKPHVTFYD